MKKTQMLSNWEMAIQIMAYWYANTWLFIIQICEIYQYMFYVGYRGDMGSQ